MSTDVEVVDGAYFNEAIQSVRSDATDDEYVLVGHVDNDPNRIQVIKVGQDVINVDDHLLDDQVIYALVRYKSIYDMSTTIKFVYFHWIGTKVPFAKKGRFGVVHGSVREHFNPYHIAIDSNSREDYQTEAVMKQLEENAGTSSNVLESMSGRQERGFTSSQLPKRAVNSKLGIDKIPTGGAEMKISEEVYKDIAAVRSDSDATKWLLTTYQNGNPKEPLVTVATGDGAIDELKERLNNEQVMYGLYRVTDAVDDIQTVKFVYVNWVGEHVKPMTKAKISTHKGELAEIFNPAHVTLFASEFSDISQRIIMDKVTSASGTRSHVK